MRSTVDKSITIQVDLPLEEACHLRDFLQKAELIGVIQPPYADTVIETVEALYQALRETLETI